ncbi:LysR substrate-binding domain-containing protein [uncultured Methylobacterium sp.]|uniref:LysR substrate-binding domain-containing protein n=1 Tax=uncultured Methylobacterium sp. TaxID=157278 RepID=UPI0035CAF3EB
MLPTNLDMDVLRTFVAGIDLGGYARAAVRLGRSPSAISLQLRKLEDQVGRPLLRKHARGLVPTEAGEVLLGYARRLLDLNDATLAALHAPAVSGTVRLGLPQDFAETHLPTTLARFVRLYPEVRITARVERNAVLRAAFAAGDLDLALLWNEGDPLPPAAGLLDLPMVWIGPCDWAGRAAGDPLALVAFDAPCLFRHAVLSALDHAGIPWRVSFSSPSLSGLFAAVTAGLGVTARTPHGLPAALSVLDTALTGLPPLPRLGLVLLSATPPTANPAAVRLEATLRETFVPGAIEP